MYEYEEIFPEELEKWHQNGAQLVDVRERWEYELGHIPEASNIPLGELPDRVDELKEPVILSSPEVRPLLVKSARRSWRAGTRPKAAPACGATAHQA